MTFISARPQTSCGIVKRPLPMAPKTQRRYLESGTRGRPHTHAKRTRIAKNNKTEEANLSSSENVTRTTKQKKTDSSKRSGSKMDCRAGRPLSRLRRKSTKTVNIWPNGPAFFALRYTQQQTLRELQTKADSEKRRRLSRLRRKFDKTASSLPNGAAFFDSRHKRKKLISPLKWSFFRRAVTTCFHVSNAPRFYWIPFLAPKDLSRDDPE